MFPQCDHVTYKHSPLNTVVCQLRFPCILKIDQENPVEFQEKIRHQYCSYSSRNDETNVEAPSHRVYTFKRDNPNWEVSLSQNYLSIFTTEYTGYKELKSRFQEVVSAFEAVYHPSYYSRIGLRYENLIIRSELGLQREKWNKLLAAPMIAELNDPVLSQSLNSFHKVLLFSLGESQAVLRHGIVDVEKDEKNIEEKGYLLDADFYATQKMNNIDDAFSFTDQFDQYSRNLFRFCISEDLHAAMKPSPVE